MCLHGYELTKAIIQTMEMGDYSPTAYYFGDRISRPYYLKQYANNDLYMRLKYDRPKWEEIAPLVLAMEKRGVEINQDVAEMVNRLRPKPPEPALIPANFTHPRERVLA